MTTIKSILSANPTFKQLAQAIVEKFDFEDIEHLFGEGEDTFEIDEYTIETLPAYHLHGRQSDEIHVSGPDLNYVLKSY